MKIQTKNFVLSISKKGDIKSEKIIIILPGKLDSKDYRHIKSHVDYFSSKGYLTVSFDPPGTWQSGSDTNIYTITNYIKAVSEIIEYFGNKRTFLIGHSMGGSVAMFSSDINKNVIGFASIMSPYKFDHFIKKIEGTVSKRDMPANNKKIKTFKLSKKFYKDAIKYNAVTIMKNSNKFKLFIYGSKDCLIKPVTIKSIYKIASEPKKITSVKYGHDYRFNKKIIEKINYIICSYLNKNF